MGWSIHRRVVGLRRARQPQADSPGAAGSAATTVWANLGPPGEPRDGLDYGWGLAALACTAAALDDFNEGAVGIHLHPVAGLDDGERILVEIRDRRHAHDHCTEGDLGGHFIEKHGLMR